MTTHKLNQHPSTVELSELLQAGLEAVEREMLSVVSSEITILRDASTHILEAGGKRVRPRVLLLAFIAAGGTDIDRVAAAGAAVELMHTASVVHDDINDHGILRCGRPSVNAKWGRTFALLTGDFLFTAVYQLMSPYGELNKILADSATALVEGETLQAYAVKNSEFTRENYVRIIALKTAALFRAAAEIGARLADADEETVQALREFGYDIGLAFQITDDILDIVGDETVLGKTAGIDITQGRGISSVDVAENGEDPMEAIKQKFMTGNRLQEAQEQAYGLIQMAVSKLRILPDSGAKDELIKMALDMSDRKN